MSDESAWEGLADEWRRRTMFEPPANVAVDLYVSGLRLVYDARLARGGCRLGKIAYLDPGAPVEAQRFAAHHEIGHLLGARIGDRSEEAANYIAGATSMPRDMIRHAVRAVGWDLPLVQAAFGMGHEATGRRLVDVYAPTCPLVLSVWSGPKLVVRYARGELPRGLDRITHREQQAALVAVEEHEPGWDAQRSVGAWNVNERRGRMTYVLADVEALGRQGARPSHPPLATGLESRVVYDEAIGDE